MLNASRCAALIQEKSCVADHSPGLIVLTRKRKIGRHILKTDSAYTLFFQGDELLIAVLVHDPDFQLIKNFISLIDKAVAVLIIGGKIRKAVSRCGSKEFGSVIDLSVAVLIEGKLPASFSQSVDLIRFPVPVDIKAEGLIRQFRDIAV